MFLEADLELRSAFCLLCLCKIKSGFFLFFSPFFSYLFFSLFLFLFFFSLPFPSIPFSCLFFSFLVVGKRDGHCSYSQNHWIDDES